MWNSNKIKIKYKINKKKMKQIIYNFCNNNK